MPVIGSRTDLACDAFEAILNTGHHGNIKAATNLWMKLGEFVDGLKSRPVDDLTSARVALAGSTDEFTRPAKTFLTRVRHFYALNGMATVPAADNQSMIYQFQLDDVMAGLAVYLHPLRNPEFKVFWIGPVADTSTDPAALPLLQDPDFDWRALSSSYARWLSIQG